METKNLKPFDIEKAKQGAKVVTRDGRPARIICYDMADPIDHIVALVKIHEDGREEVFVYNDRGEWDEDFGSANNLFMAPTIVERWVNVYKGGDGYAYTYHKSEQEALECKDFFSEYVATTKITWEE